jgi:hypothetical protein
MIIEGAEELLTATESLLKLALKRGQLMFLEPG